MSETKKRSDYPQTVAENGNIITDYGDGEYGIHIKSSDPAIDGITVRPAGCAGSHPFKIKTQPAEGDDR